MIRALRVAAWSTTAVLFWFAWSWRMPTASETGYGDAMPEANIAVVFGTGFAAMVLAGSYDRLCRKLPALRSDRVVDAFTVVLLLTAIAYATLPQFGGSCERGYGPACDTESLTHAVTHSFFFAGVLLMLAGAVGSAIGFLLGGERATVRNGASEQVVRVVRIGPIAVAPTLALGALAFMTIGYGATDVRDLERLEQHGRKTTGTVIPLPGGHKGTAYAYDVDGTTYRQRSWNGRSSLDPDERGDEVDVTYDPDDPLNATLVDPGEAIADQQFMLHAPIVIGAVFLVFTLVQASRATPVAAEGWSPDDG